MHVQLIPISAKCFGLSALHLRYIGGFILVFQAPSLFRFYQRMSVSSSSSRVSRSVVSPASAWFGVDDRACVCGKLPVLVALTIAVFASLSFFQSPGSE